MLNSRAFWLAATVPLAVSLAFLSFYLVQADTPANDDFDSATAIQSLPFSEQLDTRQASAADDDPDCFGRGPTVWYSFTAPEDMWIEANTFGSEYDTTLSVYTGSRGALAQTACNDDADRAQESLVAFQATAGETYYFMVGAFASGPGGVLGFNLVDILPPPPLPAPLDLTITIDPEGPVMTAEGVAMISGTVTCFRPSSVVIFGDMEQQAGQETVRGFFFTPVMCDREARWEGKLQAENGVFNGGPVAARAVAFDFYEPASAQASQSVSLREPGQESVALEEPAPQSANPQEPAPQSNPDNQDHHCGEESH